jgi:hypothetical protein
MAMASHGPELERAFAWMAEIGAEEALRAQDPERLLQAARHAALLTEREGVVGGTLWDEAGDRLLLAGWLLSRGVTREELESWEAGGEGSAPG